MTVNTKVIFTSVVASFLAMGQANAFVNPFAKKPVQPAPTAQGPAGNVPEGYEDLKSTDIYPYTKKIVTIINSAKDQKDAANKLCGKSLMSSGLFRQKGGAFCKANPDSAMLALSFCFGYQGFDKSDCAQNAKALLFPGQEKLPLDQLINKPIKATLFSQQIGKDRFAQSLAKGEISHGAGKTIAQWSQYFANPEGFTLEELKGYKMTNERYLLCMSKRANLPQMLRIQANETCALQGVSKTQPTGKPEMLQLQGVSKTQPTGKPEMLQQEPSLIPMESEEQNLGTISVDEYIAPPSKIQVQGALKDLNEGRADIYESEQSFSGAVGNIPESKAPQIRGAQSGATAAGKTPELRKQLLEAGKNVATAQQGLNKALQPGQANQAPRPPMTQQSARLQPQELGRAKLTQQTARLEPQELGRAKLSQQSARLQPQELDEQDLTQQSARLQSQELGRAKLTQPAAQATSKRPTWMNDPQKIQNIEQTRQRMAASKNVGQNVQPPMSEEEESWEEMEARMLAPKSEEEIAAKVKTEARANLRARNQA